MPKIDSNDPNQPALYKEVINYLKSQGLEPTDDITKEQFGKFLMDLFIDKVPDKKDLPVFKIFTERVVAELPNKIKVRNMADYLKEEEVFRKLDQIGREMQDETIKKEAKIIDDIGINKHNPEVVLDFDNDKTEI